MNQSKAKYKKTEKGKASIKRYKQGLAGKLARKRYKRSAAYKKARQREYQKNKWKYSLIYDKRRKSAVKNSIPLWLNKMLLVSIYENCPMGMTVDHIIPLQHENICGLSVPWNMQYLTKSENSIKNNRFDGTYANNGWKGLLH